MAALPTKDELLQVRSDLTEKLDNDGALTLEDWMEKALAQVKRDLKNIRAIKWAMVYDSETDDYFVDEDDAANNKDQIHQMIMLLTVSLIYSDYSIDFSDEGKWYAISQDYKQQYVDLMTKAKIEVDWNESGSIDDSEEEQSGVTRFMTK